MPVEINYIAPLNEYRCGMLDCNALLFKGKLQDAQVQIKCKCGTLNIIDVRTITQKPIQPANNGTHVDRLKLTKK